MHISNQNSARNPVICSKETVKPTYLLKLGYTFLSCNGNGRKLNLVTKPICRHWWFYNCLDEMKENGSFNSNIFKIAIIERKTSQRATVCQPLFWRWIKRSCIKHTYTWPLGLTHDDYSIWSLSALLTIYEGNPPVTRGFPRAKGQLCTGLWYRHYY